MTWLSVVGRVLYYMTLPVTALATWIFTALLVLLGPFLHLGNYILSGLLLPLRLIAKFETIYIYLGIAAIIGLVTGSLLHFSSALLVSLFNLTPSADDKRRAHVASRERRTLERAWETSSRNATSESGRSRISSQREHPEWMEKGSGRDHHGLLAQTILEEVDDSEESERGNGSYR